MTTAANLQTTNNNQRATLAATSSDISGTWVATVTAFGQTGRITLFAQQSGTSVTGSIKVEALGRTLEGPISGTNKAGELSLHGTVAKQAFKFSGKQSDANTLKGTISALNTEVPVTFKRSTSADDHAFGKLVSEHADYSQALGNTLTGSWTAVLLSRAVRLDIVDKSGSLHGVVTIGGLPEHGSFSGQRDGSSVSIKGQFAGAEFHLSGQLQNPSTLSGDLQVTGFGTTSVTFIRQPPGG